MSTLTRKPLTLLAMLAIGAVAMLGGFVWSGIYNVGADDPHTRPVYAVMEALRERSIKARANKLNVPDLTDRARIVQGAGNYNAMCTGCHLAPGASETELSKGLYPSPPNLSKQPVDAAEAFWVIKHGIKASGMPAWGKSMGDEYIWNMAAFLQKLPSLNAEQYQAMVASSGGHEHGGGESKAHDHGDSVSHGHGDQGDAADSHAEMNMSGSESEPAGPSTDHHETTPRSPTAIPSPKATIKTVERRHADGTVESHPVPQPAPADDGHDHQH